VVRKSPGGSCMIMNEIMEMAMSVGIINRRRRITYASISV
jgi:hypothetical protein